MPAYVTALHITPVFNLLSTVGTFYMPIEEVHCNTKVLIAQEHIHVHVPGHHASHQELIILMRIVI